MMKGIFINIFLSLLTIGICGALFTRPATEAEIRRMQSGYLSGEPSCEELRAMWRFSRRQSRAAEVTNELPTYRDPFARNVWEPLPRLRSILHRPASRPWSPPVYGRIVRHPPAFPPRPSAFDELYREFHKNYREEEPEDTWDEPEPEPVHENKYSYPDNPNHESPFNAFDRVKQMILAERAKEASHNKVKPGEAQPAKNALDQNKEEVNDPKGHYNKYIIEEEEKPDKLRVDKGGFESGPPSGAEGFRKPLRRSSAYTWMDPSYGGGYW